MLLDPRGDRVFHRNIRIPNTKGRRGLLERRFSAALGLTNEGEGIKLNTRCSAVVQNKLPPKEKDPWSFILLYIIGNLCVSNALANLGASISIMPFSMCKRLNLGPIKPICMTIEIADRTVCIPKGVVENVLVKIDKFTFPVDFVILDMEEDLVILLILGRPLLATAQAEIDVFNKLISLKTDDRKIIFNMDKGRNVIQSNQYVL